MPAPPPRPGPVPPARVHFSPAPGANAAAAQAIVDAFSEAQWRNLVPQQSPRDPGSVGALERCRPAGAVRYRWDAQDPDHVTFLDAAGAALATYPSDGDGRSYLTVAVLDGHTVQVPIWNLGGSATSCPLQQIIDHEKDAFLRARLNTLAAAYASPATRTEAFARRIAIALDEWARRLPDYYLTGKNGIRPLEPGEAFPMGDIQRVSDHNGVAHEVREEPVTAFDAIYDSPALAELSAQLGHDVREVITRDYFLNLMDYITTKIPLAVHVATNLSASFDETARIATILHRPELARWLNEYLALSVQNLVRDGMLPESIGYASGYLNENRSVASNLRTYFQVWPATDEPTAAIARASEAYLASFLRGIAALDSVAMPDGTMAPFGNTPFRSGRARPETRSRLLPGYGHLVLGDGQQTEQVQVNLAFNDNANHCEQDVLHFTLFGHERELLSDLRYARMPGRPFTESTVAHNTVTVNRRDQFRSNNQVVGNRGHLFTGGNLLLYEPNLAGLSVAEVDGSRAYAGTVSRYQRFQILAARDAARPYLIDLFRVTGGQTHDYALHGATLFDMTTPPPDPAAPAGASSLPLVRMDGAYPLLEGDERFVEPPQDDEPWYGAFRDVWTARSTGSWNVTFAATMPPQAVRISMLDDADVDVFVAKSPSPHRDKMPPDTPEAFYGHWRPSLLARRRGAAPLDSRFVAVIEPLRGAPAVASIERLPLAEATLDRLALRIAFVDGGEDVVLVNLTGGDRFATADGRYALEGRLGISSRRGEGERDYLVAGTRFEHAGQSTSRRWASTPGP
jgi:hypothetical protein